MSQLSNALKVITKNKSKAAVLILSTIVFSFVLFPFEDLSDLVSAQVAKLTNNKVYLQFENLGFSPLNFGLKFKNVSVESSSTPALSAQELTIAPSASMVINQKLAGSLSAKGFLRGNIDISMSNAAKSENGNERKKVVINAKELSLSELREVLAWPLQMKGKVGLDANALMDFTFTEQPDVEVTLKVDQLEIPPSSLNTPMGPLSMPDLKLSQLELKGRLSQGRFNIESGIIGKESDELSGNIKGGVGFTISNQPGNSTQLGAYDLNINLDVKPNLQQKAKFLFDFLDNYRTNKGNVSHFAFKISASNFQGSPNITPVR